MKIRAFFEPRDIWVGVYWTTGTFFAPGADGSGKATRYLHVYVCVLPLLPIRFTWTRPVEPEAEMDRIVAGARRK